MPQFFRVIAFLLLFIEFQDTSLFAQNSLANDSIYIVSDISIAGNVKTKNHIIARELTFALGDTISAKCLKHHVQRCKDNLQNTSLFNYIYIDTVVNYPNRLALSIKVEERWYTWPYPIFEHADRNFSAFLHEKDWSKINYGFYVQQYNFRGRNEYLKVKARYGYKSQYSLTYENPNIDKHQRYGVSGDISYFRQNEVSVKTANDKPQYLKLDDEFARELIVAELAYSYRHHLYNKHTIGFGWEQVEVADTVVSLNTDYFGDARKRMSYFWARYSFSRDVRDSKVYPLKGYWLNLGATQLGLGVDKESDLNVSYVKGVFSKHFNINGAFYLASGFAVKKTFTKKTPYYLKNALGYDDFLRGYEYYVIDGDDYFSMKHSFKYELLSPRVKKVGLIPFEKFNKVHYAIYCNAFFDSGYVWGEKINNNTMVNEFLYSGGVGIDFVTYYDRIVRFEFTVNKFGEKGFFIHFGAPF